MACPLSYDQFCSHLPDSGNRIMEKDKRIFIIYFLLFSYQILVNNEVMVIFNERSSHLPTCQTDTELKN